MEMTPYPSGVRNLGDAKWALEAAFLLVHGRANEIRGLPKPEAAGRLMPLIALPMPLDSVHRSRVMDEILSFACRTVEAVPFFELHFLPHDDGFWKDIEERVNSEVGMGKAEGQRRREQRDQNTMDNLANYLKITTKIKQKGIPVVAGLEVTYDCNLACKHCYVVRENGRELDLPEYCRLIDDLYDLGTFCIVFTGGEPLMRKDFFDIAGHAKRKGFLMVLFTNGTLIDGSVADSIGDLGFWKVEMSIYGATSETHDAITQRTGAFENTLFAVSLLRERGVDVSLKTLLLNMNIHEYREMKALAQSLALNFRADVQINPKLDGDCRPLDYRISEEEILFVLEERKDIQVFACEGTQYVNNLTCNAGKHLLGVSPQGEVKPCVIFPVPCGDVRERSIKEIWGNGNGILGRLRNTDVSDLVTCSSCADKAYCIRCHAASYLETGDMLNASPGSCQLARLRHELALERRRMV
jgi:radical SAM protein with 4Fe4S-binding SPASM domain